MNTSWGKNLLDILSTFLKLLQIYWAMNGALWEAPPPGQLLCSPEVHSAAVLELPKPCKALLAILGAVCKKKPGEA